MTTTASKPLDLAQFKVDYLKSRGLSNKERIALLTECRRLQASEARMREAGERCLSALRANGAPNCEAAKEMNAALKGDK